MTRTAPVLLAPLLLLLVACGPGAPTPSDDSPSEKPTVQVGETAPAEEPVAEGPVTADDYLIAGGLNEDPDGDGFWSAHYAFTTDATGAVRCDLWIFSGDDPSVLCAITPSHRSEVTYALPSGTQCDLSTANPYDGYSLSVGGKALDGFAGWSGCAEQLDYGTETVKVLGEEQTLTVPPFVCVVGGKAASCDFQDGSGGVTLGTYTAAHYG